MSRRALLLLSAIGVGAAAAIYLGAGHVNGLAAGKLLEAAAWAAFWPTLEARVTQQGKLLTYFEFHETRTLGRPRRVLGLK